MGAVLASVVDLDSPWQGFFFVGMVMFVSGLTLATGRYVVVPLAKTHLPEPPPQAVTKEEWLEAGAAERRRAARTAIHEAISTLEHHKADIERYTRPQSPTWRGDWPDNRPTLAQERRYDDAVRATERAFQAVSYHTGDAALGPIVIALSELENALEDNNP